jgi:transcriptional regulator with XRE-family HTH domain
MPRALAYTEPDVLRWARESAGYTVEQAAEKIGIARWQLEMAEEGVDYLTLRQAERAADAYAVARFQSQPVFVTRLAGLADLVTTDARACEALVGSEAEQSRTQAGSSFQPQAAVRS